MKYDSKIVKRSMVIKTNRISQHNKAVKVARKAAKAARRINHNG